MCYSYWIEQNWQQFLFCIKAAALKQQISKFYPQIQRMQKLAMTFISASGLW